MADVMCSWCHAMNSTFEKFCLLCGHRADLPRSACDCPKCWQPIDGVDEPGTLMADHPIDPRGDYDPNTLTQTISRVRLRELLQHEQDHQALRALNAELLAALKHAERFCPCGARPESPSTHPHVAGCLIGAAIAKAEGR